MDQARRDERPLVIVIAASAGGFPALRQILTALPPEFPVPILVVLHVSTHEPSHLAAILARATARDVRRAVEGDVLHPGVVYVAPPDHHLQARAGRVELTRAAKENFVRPAADPLFRSAVSAYGARVIAVILSGSGSDGARGALAVHDAGGFVLVQDPVDAGVSGMPNAAIRGGAADEVLNSCDIAAALVRLTAQDWLPSPA